MVTDNTTLADVDKALTAAWLSYQTRALAADESAGRVLDFIDGLLARRLELMASVDA